MESYRLRHLVCVSLVLSTATAAAITMSFQSFHSNPIAIWTNKAWLICKYRTAQNEWTALNAPCEKHSLASRRAMCQHDGDGYYARMPYSSNCLTIQKWYLPNGNLTTSNTEHVEEENGSDCDLISNSGYVWKVENSWTNTALMNPSVCSLCLLPIRAVLCA